MSNVPPPSSSSSPSSSRGRRSRSKSTDSAPIGIYVIAILGGIVSVLGFFPILVLMGQGGGAFMLGLVLFGLNVAQLYVLVGLVGLKSWAWTWALVLFGLSALLDLFRANLLGLIVSLVIIAYLFSKAEYYD